MPINLANTAPIDQNDFKFDALLSNLQGNILKGHGRDHTANIFVEFSAAKKAEVREWLHAFADDVTSTKKQLKENERFKRNNVPGEIFRGIYISAKGYSYFDVPVAKQPKDPSFRNGMEKAGLNDPPVSAWEANFREINIHVMILLGDDDKKTLSIETARLIEELRPLTPIADDEDFFSNFIRVEHGNAIRNENGDGLEHFGYVDGISQPLFFKDENSKFAAEATPNTGSKLHWDPFAPLSLVLVGDPGTNVTDACGSYFVFRKLEQKVRAFKQAERQLAKDLKLSDEEKELAGALVVGRFEDGTPVTLDSDDGMIGSGKANNFNYDKDKVGLRCPFQAHIRKTNPRGSGGVPGGGAGSVAFDKSRIMARRGIPYGQREVTPEIESQAEQFPQDGVGLLFMSFQAKLADQFEFIQKAWANAPAFPFSNPAGHTGIDPIIGQSTTPPAPNDRSYTWQQKYGTSSPVTPTSGFAQFVDMKGGEYFFAPSIEGLRNL